MKKWIDELLVVILIQMFLFFMTSIDYIVHHVLYKYGLIFSYNWANTYWILLFLTFQSVALLAAVTYWLNREHPRKLTVFAIWMTITAEHLGCFLDTLWFIIQYIITGSFIGWTTNWWWMFQSRIIGFWNLQINIIYNIIWLVPLIYVWYRVGSFSRLKMKIKRSKFMEYVKNLDNRNA